MAEAMIKGLLDKKLIQADQIIASDPDSARRSLLSDKYKTRVTTENLEALHDSDVVVLAIKPQAVPYVLQELQGHLDNGQIFLSIAAGVRLDTIRKGISHDTLVRAMPNTPSRIGQGMTMWTCSNKVEKDGRETVAAILGALGEEMYVDDEKYLDMATALSASGPAYIFTIMEALIDAGVHIGLTRDISEKLVIETMRGSVSMAKESGSHPAVLRNMVTSPGGTTAEALLVLEKGGLRGLLVEAVLAAYKKAQSVG